jgi:hypothetical protein
MAKAGKMNPTQLARVRVARRKVEKRMAALSLFVVGAVGLGLSLGIGPHGSADAAIRGAIGLGGVFGAVYVIWFVPMFLYTRRLREDEEAGEMESTSIKVTNCLRRSRDPRPFLIESDKGRFEVESSIVYDALKKGQKCRVHYTPRARLILKAKGL